MAHGHATPTAPGEIPKAQTKEIWVTFWILFFVTALEFVIAFTVINPEARTFRIAFFVGLTIVKAYFIVANFMHLRHEAKSLIWAVILPCTFIMWFIVAMLYEGESVFVSRY